MEAWRRDFFEGARSEEFCAAKMLDGGGDVGPRSVLDEDGADDDFKGGAAGPPVLGTMGSKESVEVGARVEGRNLRHGVCGLETFGTIFRW